MIDSLSETQRDLAVLVNEVKHLTTNVNGLTENVKSITNEIKKNTDQLKTIESNRKIRSKLYSFISSHWWKLGIVVMAIDKTYDIIRTIPK